MGLGSLGRTGEKAGEVQKRGAGKASGVEGTERGLRSSPRRREEGEKG